jgi:ATP-dependent Clp protease protease subunit
MIMTEELAGRGIYYLNGEINEFSAREAIEFVLGFSARATGDDIKIIVNSHGGDLPEAFALIEVMRGSGNRIVTVGIGEIASAGLMIFMAGDHRILTPNTLVLSHQFSTGASGKEHELYAARKMVDHVRVNVLRLYEECTGLDQEVIRKELLPSQDVWLTPEEALAYNLCDEVRAMK